MSLIQDNARHEQSVISDSKSNNISRIHAYIEVAYSKTRKAEMKAANEQNCMLLINLLMRRLEKMGATNVFEWSPTNKNRFADIVLEFDIVENKLDTIVESLKEISDNSIDRLELFLEV